METAKTNYIWLADDPPTPKEPYPSRKECLQFEYIRMAQLCEITDRHKLGRSKACNAFGGDRGQFKVISDRMARAVLHNTQPRKYVKTSAAIDYLKEIGISDW